MTDSAKSSITMPTWVSLLKDDSFFRRPLHWLPIDRLDTYAALPFLECVDAFPELTGMDQ